MCKYTQGEVGALLAWHIQERKRHYVVQTGTGTVHRAHRERKGHYILQTEKGVGNIFYKQRKERTLYFKHGEGTKEFGVYTKKETMIIQCSQEKKEARHCAHRERRR